jgi:hypothetical protein
MTRTEKIATAAQLRVQATRLMFNAWVAARPEDRTRYNRDALRLVRQADEIEESRP